MATKQKIDIREKSAAVLRKDLTDARAEVATLVLDNTMKKLKNTRSIFLKRKEIAKLLTILTEQSFASKNITEVKKEVKHV